MGNKEFQAKLDAHKSGQSNEPISAPAHTLAFDEVCQQLKSSKMDGLSPEEAKKRLEQYGKNELDNAGGVNPVKILVRQIANAMMLVCVHRNDRKSQKLTYRQVLFLAMGVSFGIGSYIEGGVVTGIIILNIVIGFMQEYSAEKTMDSLRSLSSPTTSVIRNGDGIVVPTIEVVPGDMVELKTGGKHTPPGNSNPKPQNWRPLQC